MRRDYKRVIKVECIEDLPKRGLVSWDEVGHLILSIGINHKEFRRLGLLGKAPENRGLGMHPRYTGAALARWFDEPENRAKLAANTPNPA